jgi:hypothetical protein
MRPIIVSLELGDARLDELENLQYSGDGSGITIIVEIGPRRGAERALPCVDVSCMSRSTYEIPHGTSAVTLISNGRRSGAPDEVNTLPREAGHFGASQYHVERLS